MLAILLFFISILSIGVLLVFYLKLGKGWLALSLAYGLGTAIISLELFLYFVIFRLSFSVIIFYFIGLQTLIALGLLVKKNNWQKNFVFVWQKKYWLILVLGLMVAGFLSLNFFQAISRPALAYDGISFWSMRAKMLLVDKKVIFDQTSYNYLSSLASRNYPWHSSLVEYWFRLLGSSGAWLNLIFWSYFVSLVILIISAVRRWLGAWQGLLAGLLLATMPLIFYHAYNNYADLVLAYYSAFAMFFLIEWLMHNDKKSLILAGFFSGFTLFIKNDGVFCVLAFVLSLLLAKLFKLAKVNWQYIGYTLLAVVLPILPWLVFKFIYHLGLANTDGAFAWHPEIFKALYQALFVGNNWNVWWPIFIITSLFLVKKIFFQKILLPAWLMFIFMSSGIVAVYLFTEHYRWAIDHTALSRTIIPLVPMSILLLFSSLSFLNIKKHD